MQKTIDAATGHIHNAIVFCARPWPVLVLGMGSLILLTFAWGFYLLGSYSEDDFFKESGDLSVSEFLLRDVASPNVNDLVTATAPAIVGIGPAGVNTSVVSSGAIVSPNGHVLTTLHQLQGMNEISVHVRTPNGIVRYRAEIVKAQATHDLALIKILSPDPFLFFPLADTSRLQAGIQVFGIGHGAAANVIVKEGAVRDTGAVATVGEVTITHLLTTDAVYTWEQSGGPLLNARGEIVGINILFNDANGRTVGATVPSHVIMAHFRDVLAFKVAGSKKDSRRANAASPQPAAFVPVAGTTLQQQMAAPSNLGSGGSSAWWAQARVQVAQPNPAMAMTVAGVNGPPAAAVGGPGIMGYRPQGGMMVDTEHLGGARIGGFHILDILALAFLGLIAGLVSGVVTMGGGVLHVAGMMIFFGYGIYLIRPVTYLTNLFIFGAATLRNHKSGLIVPETVRSLMPWAIVGVVAGYFLANSMNARAITLILGVFALLMMLRGLYEIYSPTHDEILLKGGVDDAKPQAAAGGDDALDEALAAEPRARKSGRKAAQKAARKAAEQTVMPDAATEDDQRRKVVERQLWNGVMGFPVGLISGLLGISGGVVSVPMLRYINRETMKNAIANSSAVVLGASLVGSILAFTHGVSAGLIEWQGPLTLAAIMIPGAYAGGVLGAKLMKVLPILYLQWFYTAVMAAVAVKMILF